MSVVVVTPSGAHGSVVPPPLEPLSAAVQARILALYPLLPPEAQPVPVGLHGHPGGPDGHIRDVKGRVLPVAPGVVPVVELLPVQ